MANMLFANNCNTTLNGGITAVATSMVVTSATGFPAPTGSQYFYCTLADAATQTTIEIVKVTAVSGTTFTIVRGQDGTTGTIFASGAVVSLRLVAANLNDFPKLDEANTFTFAPTFNTALAVGSGGTGLISLTAGYVPYGNGTSAFSSTSALSYANNWLQVSGNAGATGAPSGTTGLAFGWNYSAGNAEANIMYGTSGTAWLAFSSFNAGTISEKVRFWTSGGVSIGGFNTDPGTNSLSAIGNGMFGVQSTSLNARLIVKGPSTTSTDACATFQNSNASELFSIYEAGAVRAQYIGSAVGTALVLDSNGYIQKLSSSIRYKKDVEPIDIGLDFILGLNPVKYNLKESNEAQVGFIAEDFPDPRLTSMSKIDIEDESKGYQVESVNYAQIVAPLVKAIQELNAKFDAYVASHP